MNENTKQFKDFRNTLHESEYKETLTGYPNRGIDNDVGPTNANLLMKVNAVLNSLNSFTHQHINDAMVKIRTRLNLFMLDFPWTPWMWQGSTIGTFVVPVTLFGRVDGYSGVSGAGGIRFDGKATPDAGLQEFTLLVSISDEDGLYRVTAKLEPSQFVPEISEDKNTVKEELVGGQKRLDVNKNKRLDAQDFKLLRAKKKKPMQEETVEESKTKQWTPRLDRLLSSSRDAVRSKPKKSKIVPKIKDGKAVSSTVSNHKVVKEETKKPWWSGKTQVELNTEAAAASAARKGEEDEKRKRFSAELKRQKRTTVKKAARGSVKEGVLTKSLHSLGKRLRGSTKQSSVNSSNKKLRPLETPPYGEWDSQTRSRMVKEGSAPISPREAVRGQRWARRQLRQSENSRSSGMSNAELHSQLAITGEVIGGSRIKNKNRLERKKM